MRAATIFHPLYAYHPRPGLETAMLVKVRIDRPSEEHPEWEPGVGIEANAFTTIWEGFARVQPNIDWRARPRDFAGEFNATQAVRIQLGVGKNEHNAVRDGAGKITQYAPDPEMFSYGDVVSVLNVVVSGTEALLHEKFTVRNGLPSQNKWQYNLLCDAGTK